MKRVCGFQSLSFNYLFGEQREDGGGAVGGVPVLLIKNKTLRES